MARIQGLKFFKPICLCNLTKRETPTQVFKQVFKEHLREHFRTAVNDEEHLETAASAMSKNEAQTCHKLIFNIFSITITLILMLKI